MAALISMEKSLRDLEECDCAKYSFKGNFEWRTPKPPQKPDRNDQTLLDGVRVELIEPKDKAK